MTVCELFAYVGLVALAWLHALLMNDHLKRSHAQVVELSRVVAALTEKPAVREVVARSQEIELGSHQPVMDPQPVLQPQY